LRSDTRKSAVSSRMPATALQVKSPSFFAMLIERRFGR
jgi:hypothetical protein